MTAHDAAVAVGMKYWKRLDEVERQLAADQAADPKARPDKGLIEERWKLEGKLRLAAGLADLFYEEGL